MIKQDSHGVKPKKESGPRDIKAKGARRWSLELTVQFFEKEYGIGFSSSRTKGPTKSSCLVMEKSAVQER